LKSIPRLDQPSHTRLQIIGGRPPNLLDPPKGCSFSPRCPYARERCHVEAPPLTEAEVPGHLYACWYPVGSPEWLAAQTRPDSLVTTDATQVAAGGS
jgi:oligopeptide/dipeptide ABC transporter ATP-binding protein